LTCLLKSVYIAANDGGSRSPDLTASASVDLELMRASQLLDSDPAAAARRSNEILARAPGHPEATLLLAAACRKLGDPAAAAAALESLADAQRETPLIQLELGRAFAAGRRRVEALAAFRRAVALDECLAEAWRELAAMAFDAGDVQAGDGAYARYSLLTKAPPELSDASAALADNRLESAEAMLLRRRERAPNDVQAQRMLADIATRRENYADAEQQLIRCLELAPGYAAARYDLASLMFTQHRNSEVLPLIERLLAAEPRNIDYLSLKAQTLRLVGRHAEAIALLEATVAGSPDKDAAWLLYGHLLREVGQQSRAIHMYRRALAIRPGSGRAYASLANLKTFRFERADLQAMQELLAQGTLPSIERTHLEFALGKALEDEGRFETPFEHYARGAARHRATIGYDANATTAVVERCISVFTERFFADRVGWGSGRADPIFILGLPRSGSTLLEQILASHSQVEGTRELPDIPTIARELILGSNPLGNQAYPLPVAALERGECDALAARYLAQTQAHRPLGKVHFVDKMLSNFMHVGLIHLMFPAAAIIDMRRHPLGCGFSCFKQFFGRGINFTYDLTEMGRYYRDYARLMAHFDSVLPRRVHRVKYEQLVADPPGEVRKLLDYCRLPFEQECLHFHENRRVVQTISSEQVRRPIYSDAVDQWRHYSPWLGPLKEALGDLAE
jgi:predicted Zn-dependent protease